MTKWRKIDTEGLPEEQRQVIWYRNKSGMEIYRIGHLFDGDVNWDDRWVNARSFTHWKPLEPPKE